jgi:hypothetical protein
MTATRGRSKRAPRETLRAQWTDWCIPSRGCGKSWQTPFRVRHALDLGSAVFVASMNPARLFWQLALYFADAQFQIHENGLAVRLDYRPS